MVKQLIFVNRILNMKHIKLIGLDMDHTLIRYNTKKFEALVYDLVKTRLIESKNYPSELSELQFDFSDAIRGLVIDSRNGNILKLSRHGAIRQSYHGTTRISHKEQQSIYGGTYINLKDSNYMAVDTAFSIAFCALFSQLIDVKDKKPDKLPNYGQIARDILNYVDQVHGDGSLKSVISSNLETYVYKDPAIVSGLKHFIAYGKKFFVLTNSDFAYTKLMLEYAITPFLEQGQCWQDLFVYVITLANKPRFFYDNLKFLSIDPKTGCMTNLDGAIKPGVYQGGCAKKFTTDLGINGDEILYIGDHIYGDILRLKKDCNWRTALVVDELGEEIIAQRKAQGVEEQITSCLNKKVLLEQEYIGLCTKKIDEAQSLKYEAELEELQNKVIKADAKITALLDKQSLFYNHRWGRVFRVGAEESYFAYQVDRYACIYMEKLADLLEQSPLSYFRAPRRLLPHDV